MKIIIHAGIHKTATSSIQSTIYNKKNIKILNKNNYFYIKSWPKNNSGPIYSSFCDNPLKYHINIRKDCLKNIDKVNKRYKKIFLAECEKNNYKNLIISGEDISTLSQINLGNLKNFLKNKGSKKDIKILICTRNHVNYYRSNIQQIIKQGGTSLRDIEHNYEKLHHLYKNRIDKFTNIFGKDNVVVYSFEEAIKHERGPVRYFFKLLGFNKSDINNLDIKKSNEGMSNLATSIISFVNEKKLATMNDVKNKSRLNSSQEIKHIRKISGDKFTLSRNIVKKAIVTAHKDTLWLKNNYGIDYTNTKLPKNHTNNLSLNEKQCSEFIIAYKKSPILIKRLLIEYLDAKYLNTKDVVYKNLKNRIIKNIKNSHSKKSNFIFKKINWAMHNPKKFILKYKNKLKT